jgi:hypothetical protein
MAARFNPAPGWPAPPAGWLPPDGWRPDPAWPAAPAGWQLLIEQRDRAPLSVLTVVSSVFVGAGAIRPFAAAHVTGAVATLGVVDPERIRHGVLLVGALMAAASLAITFGRGRAFRTAMSIVFLSVTGMAAMVYGGLGIVMYDGIYQTAIPFGVVKVTYTFGPGFLVCLFGMLTALVFECASLALHDA